MPSDPKVLITIGDATETVDEELGRDRWDDPAKARLRTLRTRL